MQHRLIHLSVGTNIQVGYVGSNLSNGFSFENILISSDHATLCGKVKDLCALLAPTHVEEGESGRATQQAAVLLKAAFKERPERDVLSLIHQV